MTGEVNSTRAPILAADGVERAVLDKRHQALKLVARADRPAGTAGDRT